MTPSRRTVTLDLATVRIILTSMGLEDIDVRSFWRQARREQRDPGCLQAETDSYLKQVMARL